MNPVPPPPVALDLLVALSANRKAGRRGTIGSLARQVGVSTTLVSELALQLQEIGYVKLHRGRGGGLYITELGQHSALGDIWLALAGHAAGHAAGQAPGQAADHAAGATVPSAASPTTPLADNVGRNSLLRANEEAWQAYIRALNRHTPESLSGPGSLSLVKRGLGPPGPAS